MKSLEILGKASAALAPLAPDGHSQRRQLPLGRLPGPWRGAAATPPRGPPSRELGTAKEVLGL